MSRPRPPALPDQLLDGRWVRQLARSVAQHRIDVDDLAQEACLAALQHPPVADTNLRGWIASVLQNLVRQHRRATVRRQRREHEHEHRVRAAAHAAPADELVQRAATHGAVVRAVLALGEPYRTVVLLRFFEGLSPRAIAARVDRPLATVHTQLTRALAQLRRALDRDGATADWRALCLPMTVVWPTTLPPVLSPLLGILAMKTKTILASAAALLVSGAILVPMLSRGDDPAAGPTASNPDNAVALHARATADHPEPAEPTQRIAVDTGKAAPAAARVADAARIQGRVVDPTGRPLPDIHVVLAGNGGSPGADAESAKSGRDGAFALPAAAAGLRRIVVAEPGFATVMHAVVGAAPAGLALVVAAPAVALAGNVVRSDGHPVEGARLRIVWPEDLRARLSDNSDAAAAEEQTVQSGVAGAFVLAAARVPGAELWTTANGLRPDRRPLPQFDDGQVQIVLTVPTPAPGTIQGHVADARGVPQPGAHIALGRQVARADSNGDFVLDDDAKATLLQAAQPRHRRALLRRPAAGFPPFVLLTLGPPPLQIRGHVVDGHGVPLAGVRVWVDDATLFSAANMPLCAEGLAAGAITPEELMQQFRDGKIIDPEKVFHTTPTAAWPWARTDRSGAFVLDGLEQRDYALRAMQDRTLLFVDLAGIAAGRTDVAIAMPTDACMPRVAGRIVDHSGNPLGGVVIRAQCDAVALGNSTMHARAEATARTEADGQFELRDVPERGVYLRLDGEGILPFEYGRGNKAGLVELCRGDPEHLALVVAARRHVQVELVDPAIADSIAVQDSAGTTIVLNVFQGRGRRETDTLPLAEGRSPVFVVPDNAAVLLLHKGDTIVQRVPLHLVPGDVNRLRL